MFSFLFFQPRFQNALGIQQLTEYFYHAILQFCKIHLSNVIFWKYLSLTPPLRHPAVREIQVFIRKFWKLPLCDVTKSSDTFPKRVTTLGLVLAPPSEDILSPSLLLKQHVNSGLNPLLIKVFCFVFCFFKRKNSFSIFTSSCTGKVNKK